MKVLTNLMEKAVFSMIDDLHEKKEFHLCEKCRLDIAAIALNNLPPRYVATTRGSVYAKADLLNLQYYVDLVAEVSKAINIVVQHPRH